MSKTIYFDVDETLIMWEGDDITSAYNDTKNLPNSYAPYIRHDDIIFIDKIPYRKHIYHIDRLIHHKQTGDKIVVWSAGGEKWATRVITELGLIEYVDVILSKPDYYYDDVELKDFKSGRMYFDHETLRFRR